MIKKFYTCLSLILMLATAAPVLSPALPVQAAADITADGSVSTGWVSKSGNWYYFDQKDGRMKTGWIKDKNKWYYLSSKDGKMVTGWLVLNPSGKKYYLQKDGSMVQGPAWASVGSGKYFINENGEVSNGWELKNGKWYYYSTDGTTVKNRWVLYKNHYYYLASDGVCAAGTVKIDGKEHRFGKNCELLGTIPSSVAAAAKAPLTTEKLKSGAAYIDTDPGSSASSAKTNTASSEVKEDASKAAAAAITKVVGKLNETTESRKQFVIQIAGYVRKYAPQYGIKVYSPIIAQAIHESGWGESSLSAKYHNYFGLKCGTLWTGKSVNLSTKEEYSAGSLTTIRSNFRVYDNMEQGVKGYFEFIQLPRYSNLKGVTSAKQYLTNIKNDGYATGYLYVDHTMALVNMYDLTQFDK